MEQYTAWMADLKSSRGYALSDRSEIQSYIARVCDALNAVFAPSLAQDVAFSAGDELQGLFKTAAAAYCHLRLFRMLLQPVQLRAGLGRGSWDIRLPDAGTTAQDGQAYHRAREAIHAAAKRDHGSLLFCEEAGSDPLVNFAIDTEDTFARELSASQNDLMLLAELLYPISVPGTMDLELLPKLANLAHRRDGYEYYARRERRAIFSGLEQKPRVIEPVDPARQEDPLCISGGRTRGMAAAVADCAGIARQSVVRTMVTANIYSARNAAIAAVRLLEKEGMQ